MADSSIVVDPALSAAAFRAADDAYDWKASASAEPLPPRWKVWKDRTDQALYALQDAGPRTLYQRIASVSTTVDATPVTLGSATIPGGSIGLGGHVSAKFAGGLTVGTGGGDTMEFVVTLGAATLGTIILADTDLTIASWRYEIELCFGNVASAAVQVGTIKVTCFLADGTPGAGIVAGLAAVGNADSTTDLVLTVTAEGSDVSDMSASCTYGNITLAPVGA